MLRTYLRTCYYFFLLMFFIGIWALNIVCWVTDKWPFRRPRPETVRYWICCLNRIYVFFMTGSRTLVLNQSGEASATPIQGRIIVCNHPTLLDAPLLLARDPSLVCIYKASLQKMLLKKRTARMAGYLANDGGVEVIREAARLLKSGANLLVFPEGTRTEDGQLNPFNSGYALIAKRAGAMLQPVVLRTEAPLLGKGRHFMKPPELPSRYHLQWLPPISPVAFPTVTILNNAMQALFSQALSGRGLSTCGFEVLTQWGQGTHWLLRVPLELPFIRGHFPDNPIVPGYWIVDALERLWDEKVHQLNGHKSWHGAKFLKPLEPGSVVHLEMQQSGNPTRFILERDGVRCFTGTFDARS